MRSMTMYEVISCSLIVTLRSRLATCAGRCAAATTAAASAAARGASRASQRACGQFDGLSIAATRRSAQSLENLVFAACRESRARPRRALRSNVRSPYRRRRSLVAPNTRASAPLTIGFDVSSGSKTGSMPSRRAPCAKASTRAASQRSVAPPGRRTSRGSRSVPVGRSARRPPARPQLSDRFAQVVVQGSQRDAGLHDARLRAARGAAARAPARSRQR